MDEMATAGADTFGPIARFALDAPGRVPESALRMAATLLIDTLAVAAGGAGMDAGRIARDFAADFHGAGGEGTSAPMLFDGRRVSLPGAAWALATQIDNLDGHDGYNPTKGHIGCAVVPALFAFAGLRPGLTGREALEALAISYEIAARAGIALHATTDDYHTSGAWNALGVAALGCRLLGAGSDTLREALGIAEYHGPRSQMMREIANPTMLHDGSGAGALAGTMAALLAQRGFTGAPAVTVEGSEVSGIWADLGRTWTVELNYVKPYPICRWAHAAIDALRVLMREEGVSAASVDCIEVNTFAEAACLYPAMPATTSQAQYSLPFALATMLVHGRIGPEHVAGEGLRDRAVAEILPRIKVTEDTRHSCRFPQGRWSDVTAMLKDGRRLASGDVHARGGPEAPMDEAELREKFDAMTAHVLDPDRAGRIWRMRERLLNDDAGFSELAALVDARPDGNRPCAPH